MYIIWPSLKGIKKLLKELIKYYLPKGEDYNSLENSTFFKNLILNHKINIIINQIGFSINELVFIKNNVNTSVKIVSVHHNCLKCLNDQYHNIYVSTLIKKGVDKLFDNKWGWYILRKIHKFRFRKAIKQTYSFIR